MSILVLNTGSSSIKFALYTLDVDLHSPAIRRGAITGLLPGGTPEIMNSDGTLSPLDLSRVHTNDRFDTALNVVFEQVAKESNPVHAIAHRVVHGADLYRLSTRISSSVLSDLQNHVDLAPLHLPRNIQGIHTALQRYPHTPQIACFDTAFHSHMPIEEQCFALPEELTHLGLKRYGFHGLSYQHVLSVLQTQNPYPPRRLLMAHLGNGASLCACREGVSVATTMGFSTLDGLVMGTRCGQLDPGVLLYLLSQGWTLEKLQHTLYEESGLKGVSGISADMRTLRASGAASAHKAISLFTHRIVREAGALIASMGGVDALSFSGGIGEHDAPLRADICQHLAFLGIEIDINANFATHDGGYRCISTADSPVAVWVVSADEERSCAREARRLLTQED